MTAQAMQPHVHLTQRQLDYGPVPLLLCTNTGVLACELIAHLPLHSLYLPCCHPSCYCRRYEQQSPLQCTHVKVVLIAEDARCTLPLTTEGHYDRSNIQQSAGSSVCGVPGHCCVAAVQASCRHDVNTRHRTARSENTSHHTLPSACQES